MPVDLLPLPLRSVLESGRGILFLGAGIGFNALDEAGKNMPTSAELAAELAANFKINTDGSTDLGKVAQVVENREGRQELNSFLSKRLFHFEPDEHLKWLLSLTWRAIFTT